MCAGKLWAASVIPGGPTRRQGVTWMHAATMYGRTMGKPYDAQQRSPMSMANPGDACMGTQLGKQFHTQQYNPVSTGGNVVKRAIVPFLPSV